MTTVRETTPSELRTLDHIRRARLRNTVIVLAAAGAVLAGLGLLLDSGSHAVALAALAGGGVLVGLRVLNSRLPEWVTITLLFLVIAVMLLSGPVSTGNAAGSAFFVGVLVLVAVASGPSRMAWWAVGAAAITLAIIWAVTNQAQSSPEAGGGLTWGVVLLESAFVAGATLIDLTILLRLADDAATDRDQQRRLVHQLTTAVAAENAQLETIVADRTAHLATAVRDRDLLTADLREASSVDPGSGLPNLRRWEAQLPVLLAQAREVSALVCVAVLDLDSFSEVNNRLGHLVGDEVIRRIAYRLRHNSSSDSLVSRIGGEEFGIAVMGIDQATAVQRLQLLQAAVASEEWEAIDVGLSPTFSVGIVEVSPDAVGDVSSVAREAVHHADLAMQRAKREGRNRIVVANPL